MSSTLPPGSPDPGESQDKDIPDATAATAGEYTRSEVPADVGGDGAPEDDGGFTDTDVTDQHRPIPAAGSYTGTDPT